MKEEVIQTIISQLELKGLLTDCVPVTSEEFMEKLYANSDERKEILKAIMSLFSEDYRTDLQNTAMLDIELSQKINELEFVTEKKKIHFVLSKCTKEEQEVVYEKMFRALNLLLIAEDQNSHIFLSNQITENLPIQGTQPVSNKFKKYSKKKFNLEQAMKNLETAQTTLEDVSQFLQSQQNLSVQSTQHESENVHEKEEMDLSKLARTVEFFKRSMESHASSTPECLGESQTTGASELGTAVQQLHSVLQYVANATKTSSSEETETKKKFNLEKMLERTRELEKNSIVSKCFSRDNNNELDE